ncbi:MAG: glycosyltransferase family 39 protein, partial [Candidatus Omnitrophica bacterium]|nr:glycosyltransferase family 39 protein [Candidatus Omnitrophota bacterium]
MIIVKDRNKFSFRYMMHLFLLLTFFCIALLSFSNIERSYSPLKYNGPSTLNDLLDHYKEYKTDFKVFVYKTYIFQQGDSKTSKNSFYFLFPVFLGVDLMGGLSFSNLYRVTIVFGLISLLILFLFLKSYWNTYIAFFSCLFYGVSPWFQELFRTETYHGPTVLIALLILYTSFKFIEKKCDDFYIVLPFIIGILIGISYYYYGVIRGLFIFAIIIIAICKENKVKNFFMFFFGIFLVLAWGIYLRLDNGGIFFDEENFLTVSRPLRALIKRNFSILSQIFTPIVDQSSPSEFATHSRLLHPYLFLPFILGFIYSMMQKQRNYRLFKIFSLVIYLSILVTSNCQVRRLTLMIIPI